MKFRTLDENHDWTFGKGLNNYSKRNNAIAVNIKTRILSWVGDCFFAQTEGIDWYNRLGDKNQRALLEQDLRKVILQSEGVSGILQFDTILNGRDFSLVFKVETIYSENIEENITIGS